MHTNVEMRGTEPSKPPVTTGHHGTSLPISSFPEEVRGLLHAVDNEGNGLMDMDELTEILQGYMKLQQQNKSETLELSLLPAKLREICTSFDVDGDGRIQAFELARAAEMFQAQKKKAAKLMRVVVLLVLFVVVMLASITGLVFAVVELSKETKVNSDGTMLAAGGTDVVKVASSETFVDPSGKMRTSSGAGMSLPSATSTIALRFSTPLQLFKRLDVVSVSEPEFSAFGKVLGAYKLANQAVVTTNLFKIIMTSDGGTVIETLEEDLTTSAQGTGRHLLGHSGGGGAVRRLLQAQNTVTVTVADEITLTTSSGESAGGAVLVHSDVKCSNVFTLEASTLEECTKAVVDRLGTDCAGDPVEFGFYSSSSEGESAGCYCVPAGKECDIPLNDHDNRWSTPPLIEQSPGWDVYFLDVLSEEQRAVQAEWDATLGATSRTPVPEDPNIELVTTGEVCLQVKPLIDHWINTPRYDDENDNIHGQYTGQRGDTSRNLMTVDECMALALDDPLCTAHGPTIQFHDIGPGISMPSVIDGPFGDKLWFGFYHCSCSVQCKYDTTTDHYPFKDLDPSPSYDPNERQALVTHGSPKCEGTMFVIRQKHRWNDQTQSAIAWWAGRVEPRSLKAGTRRQNVYGVDRKLDENNEPLFSLDPKREYNTCLDEQDRYKLTAQDDAVNAGFTTNIYTWKGEHPCIDVNIGPSTGRGGRNPEFVRLQDGYVCPVEIESEGIPFHVIQMYRSTAPHRVKWSQTSTVGVVRSDGPQVWDHDLKVRCCRPRVEDVRGQNAKKQIVNVGLNVNNERGRWYWGPWVPAPKHLILEGVVRVKGVLPAGGEKKWNCPSKVTKENWIGGYKHNHEFIVTVQGSDVWVKRAQVNCGSGETHHGWDSDDMWLAFECEEVENEPEEYPSYNPDMCQELVVGPMSGTHDGRRFSIPDPHPGIVCPRSAFDYRIPFRVDPIDGSHGTFDVYRVENTNDLFNKDAPLQWKRVDWGWENDLRITCCPVDCVDVHIGGSDNYKNNGAPIIPKGYTCPSVVTKDNWSSGDTFPDVFGIKQETIYVNASNGENMELEYYEGIFDDGIAIGGSELTIQRADAPGAGWGMNLGFQCCMTNKNFLNPDVFRVNYGANADSDSTHGRTVQVPPGYVCPYYISRDSGSWNAAVRQGTFPGNRGSWEGGGWHGGYPYPDKFTIQQNGPNVTVFRDGCVESTTWGMDLQFDCIKEKSEFQYKGGFIGTYPSKYELRAYYPPLYKY